MTNMKVIEVTINQFTDGDIDLGEIDPEQIVLLLVHGHNLDHWYRVDVLPNADHTKPPALHLFGPCATKEQALTRGAGAAH
jgi:hypothetical protein